MALELHIPRRLIGLDLLLFVAQAGVLRRAIEPLALRYESSLCRVRRKRESTWENVLMLPSAGRKHSAILAAVVLFCLGLVLTRYGLGFVASRRWGPYAFWIEPLLLLELLS